ncbi:type III-A CRISPR-associated protein Cas10/Csm1 [Streptococcus australis]|uniref:type III-A CRISPR-associated protein Cas10/Csm1 n=1 Tax=Streptococcus australis TaxID=113107 RepID=UPI0039C4BBF9
MKKEKIDLVYGSLLHAVGKVIQRSTDDERDFGTIGAEWFRRFSDNEKIAQQIAQATSSDVTTDLAPDSLVYITSAAAKIASGLKGAAETQEGKEDFLTKQSDIFNVFSDIPSQRYLDARPLELAGEANFARESDESSSPSDYPLLVEILEKEFERFDFSQSQIDSLLNLFESTLSYVPASTKMKELSDISLATYSRLTAGFALAIADYLAEKNYLDYEKVLVQDIENFYDQKAFLLASFDLSGIQDFIYNIATAGAAKQLKARSLYLDFMGEHIADSLLEKLELTRANLLYVGGGHAYFILPNTEKTRETLASFEAEFNRFLVKHFQTGLYVAFGWSPFSANDMTTTLANYRKVYQTTSRMISQKKISRYDAKTLLELNQGGKSSQRECAICHSVEKLTKYKDQEVCHICAGMYRFSKEIQEQYYLVTKEKGLPIGPGAYIRGVSKDELAQEEWTRVYVKNSYSTDILKATHVFVGDYKYAEIDQYANLSKDSESGQGIKRLAVLRLDVDDLGAAFMAGFSYQDGGKYNTLARSATFSRIMSLFFKVYINQFAKEKKLSIIYAGGDDVFAIGSWQDVIEFTVCLRQNFIKWTNGKLTLSAGIGLFPDKTPVSLMAEETGDLEGAAKDNDKDSISLFDKSYTLKFDQFIENVYRGKLEQIRYYFNSQDERGKSFVYKLMELLRNYDRMNIARLAYYLTRLEDHTSKDKKEEFRTFKDLFFSWYTGSESERKEAELALLLYVYEIRKDS